jgi:hypothetical protein
VKVTKLLAVALAGLKTAVSPAGKAPAVSATLPVKPPDAPIARMELSLFGREMVIAEVEGVRVNFGNTTVIVTVVEAVSDPETPLIVIVEVPAAAVLPAVNVSTLPVVEFAPPKTAVTPAGKVPVVSTTAPVKPFRAPTTMEEAPLLGRLSVSAGFDGVRVKLGVATVTATVVDALRLPETPLIVTL